MRLFFFALVASAVVCVVLACGPDNANPAFSSSMADAGHSSSDAGTLRADTTMPVAGVDDGARDPSVVFLEGAGRACTAVLVAGDAVLTSSACVGQADSPAESLVVRESLNDPPAAHGARVLLSPVIPTVGAAFAMVLLDRPMVDALPTWVRSAPVISGEHLRTAGFENSDDLPRKTLRDHLSVVSARLDDFVVSEAPCAKEEGAPAFDEDTEELVGMVLNAKPCGDPYAGTTYARVLPMRDFSEQALGEPTDPDAGSLDGGKRQHGSKGRTLTDLRDACEAGADCSTGVCIDQKGSSTCSRSCGSSDRCPTTFHCQRAITGDDAGVMVCADP